MYMTPPPSLLRFSKEFDAAIHVPSTSASTGVVSNTGKLTLHANRLTPLRASQSLVQAMPSWSVKTRRGSVAAL